MMYKFYAFFLYKEDPKVLLIDERDVHFLEEHKYTLSDCSRHGTRKWYLRREERGVGGKRVTIYLHREIMNAPRGLVVDHLNGNGLDCRRDNMKVTWQKENASKLRQKKQRGGK